MSKTTTSIGCTHCGQMITISSPDHIHTVAARTMRWGFDVFDYIPMNVKCTKCDQNNFVLWYRSSSNPWFRFN
jgi:ribosomal protein S27E